METKQEKTKTISSFLFWGVILTEKPIVMLCHDGSLEDLKRQGLAAEEKFDGTRIKIEKKNGVVTLVNRHRIDYTHRLTELVDAAKAIKGDFIIDAEAVFINPVTKEVEFTPCQGLLGA